jgi:23S rRNA pseudouridine1911/1915/1917 synthase
MVCGKMNNLNVLYEDNQIIVVEKPVNVLSQSDITGDKDLLTMVKGYVKEKYNKPGNVYIGLVHRLDRPVGGIMVFARTSKAAKRLNEQIKNHTFNKTYVAILDGVLKKTKDELVNYLYKDSKTGKSKVVDKDFEGAKLSKLTYEVVGYYKDKTIVKINLITGRHHQIRLQFKDIGYPLLGDSLYGKKDNEGIRLYAYKLEFNHTVTKEKLTFKLLPKWKEIENETIIHRF